MKFGLTLKDIKVGEKANIGEVTINVQYTADELVTEYGLVKQIIKELPETVNDLANAAITFEQADEAFNKYSDEKCKAINECEEGKDVDTTNALNKLKSVIKIIGENLKTA